MTQNTFRGYSLTWDGATGALNGMPLAGKPGLGFAFDAIDTRPAVPTKTVGGVGAALTWAETIAVIDYIEAATGAVILVSGADADGIYRDAAPASEITTPLPGLPAAPNGELWRWGASGWFDARTPEELAAHTLAARIEAKQRLATAADAMAQVLTGVVPLAEQLSWPVKEAAARATLAGTADSGQTALLAAEAVVAGETVADLAGKVIANAAAYHAASGYIAGWRRKTMQDVDTAADDAAIAAIVSQAIAEAEAQMAALG